MSDFTNCFMNIAKVNNFFQNLNLFFLEGHYLQHYYIPL